MKHKTRARLQAQKESLESTGQLGGKNLVIAGNLEEGNIAKKPEKNQKPVDR